MLSTGRLWMHWPHALDMTTMLSTVTCTCKALSGSCLQQVASSWLPSQCTIYAQCIPAARVITEAKGTLDFARRGHGHAIMAKDPQREALAECRSVYHGLPG